jgi:MFS family permease
MAFCVLLGEGAMADWSAVYLREGVGTGPGLGAAGYAAFSLAMAAGRLAGDGLAARLGSQRLVRLGGALAAMGLGLALVQGGLWATLAGFGLVGAGFSIVFPNLLSAAGRSRDQSAGAAIAALSTVGYTGFMAGPPLIGFAAEWVSLRGALGLIVLCGAAIAGLARAIKSS